MTDIQAINRSAGLVIDTKNHVGQIADWLDSDGDECEPERAVAAIAECGGRWWCIDLDKFETVAIQ